MNLATAIIRHNFPKILILCSVHLKLRQPKKYEVQLCSCGVDLKHYFDTTKFVDCSWISISDTLEFYTIFGQFLTGSGQCAVAFS